LHGYIKTEEAIQLGYSTFTRWLHNENYRLKTPRSWPVDQDQEARKQFQEDLQPLLQRDDLEVWFADESGFLGDPRPRRIWAKKGSKPTTPSTGMHLRESVIGAVCPRSGALSALIVERVNSDVFQVFLDQLAEETRGKRIILVLDNATWHKTQTLTWQNLEPMYLPAYSPDMNPIERLWLVMKARHFTQWYTKEWNVLFDRIFEALKSFMKETQVVQSICHI